MNSRVDANFKKEIKKFGAGDWNACFHCGNCTAICPLTENGSLFPRKSIRQMQMGLKESLAANVDPWLCYYCGECSETCPRDANPGELMMSLRRYITTVYDWTGLSKKFYSSKTWEFGALALISLLILVLFILFHGPMTTELTSNGGVQLNTFAPWKQVEIGDWIMAGLLSFFLLTNVFNMYLKIILEDKKIKIPIRLYFTEFWSLIINFFTQKKFSKCEKDRTYWIFHVLLMTSYIIMFTVIVVFLGWFQTDTIHPWWHAQRILGYYASCGLIFGTGYFFIGRIKKDRENNKYSHYSDWTFLVLLILTTISGIMVHIFRIYGMPMATYLTYVIHLMILFPMLMIEVPFSKWSHIAYRPFAIYFSNLKKSALAIKSNP